MPETRLDPQHSRVVPRVGWPLVPDSGVLGLALDAVGAGDWGSRVEVVPSSAPRHSIRTLDRRYVVDPILGEIRLFGFNFAPTGWAMCQGQILSIQQYPALFSLLFTMHGGDGQTTFKLPDLRGRAPMGMGQGPGLPDYPQGEAGASGSASQITGGSDVGPGYLSLNWCIALEGVYPSRP